MCSAFFIGLVVLLAPNGPGPSLETKAVSRMSEVICVLRPRINRHNRLLPTRSRSVAEYEWSLEANDLNSLRQML